MKKTLEQRTTCRHNTYLAIIYLYFHTSKTPAGRQATEGRSRNALWNAPGRGAFWLGHVSISSDSNSFANRFSSSSYVDPPSFRLQLTPGTTFLVAFPKKRSQRAFGRAGRTHISRIHSNGQPSVAIIAILLRYRSRPTTYNLPRPYNREKN